MAATLRFSGDAAPEYSTGQAMEELKNIARQLPAGFSLEWAGLSLQEQQASDQVPLLMELSLVVVLLVLVVESWTIPFAVLLIVPVGMFGAVAAVTIMGMPNDVYFKVGLITIIGLLAKNAILIVEFAKALHAQGAPLAQAAAQAPRLRFRPIIMTSMAFILGVVPPGGGLRGRCRQPTGNRYRRDRWHACGNAARFLWVPVFFVWVLSMASRLRTRRVLFTETIIEKGE